MDSESCICLTADLDSTWFLKECNNVLQWSKNHDRSKTHDTILLAFHRQMLRKVKEYVVHFLPSSCAKRSYGIRSSLHLFVVLLIEKLTNSPNYCQIEATDSIMRSTPSNRKISKWIRKHFIIYSKQHRLRRITTMMTIMASTINCYRCLFVTPFDR